ncbi:MAG: PulJ/GspJ family protein [Candidatus Scalindua sp.]
MIRTINNKNTYQPPRSGEAGFTMIELIIVIVLTSILGTFIFQIVTNSLNTLITMRTRKERADDAIMTLEKISREVREANNINVPSSGSYSTTTLTFTKNATSSLDSTNLAVRYMLDSGTIRRESATGTGGLGGSTSGDIVAKNVSYFKVTNTSDRVDIELTFTNGSEWETKIYPRNYNLPPP